MKYIMIVKCGDDGINFNHRIDINNWMDNDDSILIIIKEQLIKYFNETRMINEDDKQKYIDYFSYNFARCNSIEKLNDFIKKSIFNEIFMYSINNKL